MNKQSKKVKYSFDPENPPALTQQQHAELDALEARSDDEIDTSDIPSMSDEEWQNAQPMIGRFYKPIKKQVTVRIDADVLAWLKGGSEESAGYQTRLNQLLRDAMKRSYESAA